MTHTRVLMSLVPAVVLLAGCAGLQGRDDEAYLKSKSSPYLVAPPAMVLPERDQTYRVPQASAAAARPVTAAAPVPSSRSSDESRPPAVAAAPKPNKVTQQSEGELRWLSVPQPPERVWEPLKAFWAEQGVKVAEDRPEVGVLRTEWINEKPNIPQGELQRLVAEGGDGKEALLRYQYRMRVEATTEGSNVFLTYQGARLIKGADGKPRWQLEAAKPELETVMLNRLQQRLSRL